MPYSKDKTPWILLVVILTLSWILLVFDLEGKSLWTDEIYTAEWASLPLAGVVQHPISDVHPPLYFLLVRLWSDWAGHSDFALRWLSVAAAWLGLALLFRLGRRWGGVRVGLLGAALWGLSPLVILYGRMARYYSLAALLGLVSCYAFWQICSRDRTELRWWLVYVLSSWAALYTFYLTGLLVLAQGGLAVSARGRRGTGRWLVAAGLVTLGLLPWIGIIVSQTVRTGGGAADMAFGLKGLVMKAGYPAYAVVVGENLFPWNPLATVGTLALLVLVVGGIVRWRERRLALALVGLVIIPVAGMMLVTTLLSPRTPFVSMPARSLFAIPYFFVILGAAWGRFRPRLLVPLLAVVAMTWSAGLFNYYHNRQSLNPIYLTPAREMVELVTAQLEPGDAIFSPQDSGFGYYYAQSDGKAPHYSDAERAIAHFEGGQAGRVWLVTLGRDQTRGGSHDSVEEWLRGDHLLTASWRFVPQDPTYRAIKSYLLGRPAYEHRAVLSLYTRPDQ